MPWISPGENLHSDGALMSRAFIKNDGAFQAGLCCSIACEAVAEKHW